MSLAFEPDPSDFELGNVIARATLSRTAQAAAGRLGLGFRFVEPEGYLFAVSDGVREAVLGSGACSPYAQNPASAYTLCRDKAYTNRLLGRAGLPVIPSRLFFLDGRRSEWRNPGRERADLERLSDALIYPVFAKPNMGSRGELAERISSREALHDWIGRAAALHETVLIQPIISGAEYRVFVMDGEAQFSYRKVAANGPANLAQGGEIEGFRDGAMPALAALARGATEVMGLSLAGIDLFDTGGEGRPEDLVLIEVNANPNIESLERVGRDDLIDRIWAATFRAALG